MARDEWEECAVPTQVEDVEARIRRRIEEIVGPQKFKVWFKNSTQLACADGFVKVGVPNLFIGQWIEDHFAEAIGAAAREILGRETPVTFAIDPILFRNLRKSQLNSQAAFIEKNTCQPTRGAAGGNGHAHAVGLPPALDHQ